MKMVSAAKYAQAERRLKPARTYGAGAVDVYDKTGAEGPEAVTKQLIIAISSDRGLCGGIHSGIDVYDSIDADVLQSCAEFQLASIIYFAMKENACSEQSARMTAMDNASKNASEMIDKLQVTYNRTRQAVITKELIEIISGAAAV